MQGLSLHHAVMVIVSKENQFIFYLSSPEDGCLNPESACEKETLELYIYKFHVTMKGKIIQHCFRFYLILII